MIEVHIGDIDSKIKNCPKEVLNIISNKLFAYYPNYERTDAYNTFKFICNNCGIDNFRNKFKLLQCKRCASFDLRKTEQRKWDGKVKYLNYTKFKTGLLKYIIYYLDDLKLFYKLIDNRKKINYPVELITEYKNLKLKEIQIISLDKILNHKLKDIYFTRGILDLATNYGKTYLMLFIYINFNFVNTLITVHSKFLFEQHVKFFNENGFIVNTVANGKVNLFNSSTLTLAMYGTLNNAIKKDINLIEVLNRVKVLMVDESHRAISTNYVNLINKIPSPVKLFFSGTPYPDTERKTKLDLESISGTVIDKVTNDNLISNNYSSKIKIKLYKYFGASLSIYEDEELEIINNKNRNKIILKECKKGKVLISIDKIKHGEKLYKYLTKNKINCKFIHEKEKNKLKYFNKFSKGVIDVLISTKIIKEGINEKSINKIIYAGGGKSLVSVNQILGRGLRKDEIKNKITVVDFIDNGKHTKKHSEERIKIYTSEGYKIIYK